MNGDPGIVRRPEGASKASYDLIVVGGGIYGAMLALEATLRDLKVLLLEKNDFGGQTSYNSLKTIHSGLRRLQALDFKGFREFAREQRWYLTHFPELVSPLPVLMPLYQRGLHRKGVLRAAFLVSRMVSPIRRDLKGKQSLPRAEILSPSGVLRLFPGVDPRNLKGGALWYDASIPDTVRLIIEVLRAACSMGATALNYVSAVDLLKDQNRVMGVRAVNLDDGVSYDFVSPTVINAAGPWAPAVARRLDRDVPDLFRPSAGWNVLFDRKEISRVALALTPQIPGGRVHFFHSLKGWLLVGTGHAPRSDLSENPVPSDDELHKFLQDVNAALPGLELTHKEILHVFAGFLPVDARRTTRLSTADRFVDHSMLGGSRGLYSLCGTRMTTARSTAEKVIEQIFPGRVVSSASSEGFRKYRAHRAEAGAQIDLHKLTEQARTTWYESLREAIETEAVCHLDDLLLRRTNLGGDPKLCLEVAPEIAKSFHWSVSRQSEEIERVEAQLPWVRRDEALLQGTRSRAAVGTSKFDV